MSLSVEQIIRLYQTAGAARYGMEAVNQEQHALQCALLAAEAGAGAPLQAAALLHDIGHLLAHELPESAARKDDLHEYRALPFLRGTFPDAVVEPVRLHVAAKRYLCAVDAGYWETLSAASRRSLEAQGGPFTDTEAGDFIRKPHAADAVQLRRWDDCAKSPTRATPGWEQWGPLLHQVGLPAAAPA